ncbi:MAG TPA: potassium channel family protein [Candidatus Binatia bacterium]|jgi:hypothetical protein
MPGAREDVSRVVGSLSADHGLSAMLVLLVLLIVVIQPLGELGVVGRVLATLYFSLTLISGVWTVAGTRRGAAAVGALVAAGVLVRGMRLWHGNDSFLLSSALVSCVFCIVVAAVVLAQVFRAGPITFHRIRGAVAAYLLFGLAWAFAYEAVAIERPDAFVMPSRYATSGDEVISHFVYFSFVTLTTVGYGEMTAIHPVARSLVILEALAGQLFPAILLARLVSLQTSRHDGGT